MGSSIMNITDPVCLYIFTPQLLNTEADCERVFGLWKAHLPDCLPDKFDFVEPVRMPFNKDNWGYLLKGWKVGTAFMAKRKNPKISISINSEKGKRPIHSYWAIKFQSGEVSIESLLNFLRHASEDLEAHFSCLALMAPAEVAFARINGTISNLDRARAKFGLFLYSRKLQQLIPDIYWLTVFGAPYVKMFGRERLLSTPVFKAEAQGEQVVLQLTPSIEDVRNATAYEEVKKRVKAHLGEDAFFMPGKPEDFPYRHPSHEDFGWQVPPTKPNRMFAEYAAKHAAEVAAGKWPRAAAAPQAPVAPAAGRPWLGSLLEKLPFGHGNEKPTTASAKSTQAQEALQEFSTGFSFEELEIFLKRLVPLIESGFGEAEVRQVCDLARGLGLDEEKALKFRIRHAGMDAVMRIELFADDVNEVAMYLFAPPALAKQIDAEFDKYMEGED